MFSVSPTLQAGLQTIVFVLLAFISYTYFVSKQQHAKLFGMGLLLLGLSYASWIGSTLLWTNPFVEYKSLAYIFQLASILVFIGCAINLTANRYHKVLNYILIALSVLIGVFMVINPFLSGAFIYSLRYYLSFADSATLNVYAIIMAIALVLASFSVEPKKPQAHFLNSKKVGFIVLAICLAISITSYNDNIRFFNAIILVTDLVFLAISHLNISISNK
jgi:hypothetical protein